MKNEKVEMREERKKVEKRKEGSQNEGKNKAGGKEGTKYQSDGRKQNDKEE